MNPQFTFAFQPIVDAVAQTTVSFEALVRGPHDEPSSWVMGDLSGRALHEFDVLARERAIDLAKSLDLPCHLNLNMQPASTDELGETPLANTVARAQASGLGPEKLVIEISETETIANYAQFVAEVSRWRHDGVQFAIDDFGAGFSGLNLLAEFQPDSIKLDRVLVQEIHTKGPRQAIVRGVVRTCEDLGIDIIAEGVETIDEYEWLLGEGLTYFQGYLFARPAFQHLPDPVFPPL